jgi:phosphonatase-like hydrolase
MPIRLVVFDMAGTTVRDNDAVNHCLRYALAEDWVEVTREAVNQVMGLPKPTAIRILLDKHQSGKPAATTSEVDSIHDRFLKRMIQYYQTHPDVREIPGAKEVFQQLKAANIKTALDTGFSRPILDAILKRLDWDDPELLDATVASDEVAHGRPAPDLIFEAMKRAGVSDPALVAKVGDTPSDLLEGQAAGCRCVIGVTYGSHLRTELMGLPHTHLIDSLGEVVRIVKGAF